MKLETMLDAACRSNVVLLDTLADALRVIRGLEARIEVQARTIRELSNEVDRLTRAAEARGALEAAE
jgi:hypothetical protein